MLQSLHLTCIETIKMVVEVYIFYNYIFLFNLVTAIVRNYNFFIMISMANLAASTYGYLSAVQAALYLPGSSIDFKFLL